MKIEPHRITVRDVVKNYINNEEEGVIGYDGKLNIRPKYQREFVYKAQQRAAVMETVIKGFPLNVMYWIKNEDGTFEILDGQQRTVSICQYVSGEFTLNEKGFRNLTDTMKEQILNYELMIYFCEGNDQERLDWFEVINTAGEKLTPQELRNAIYTGTWLTDAKSKFSKTGCGASLLSKGYVKGDPIRQELLETAINWISNGDIGEYMASHQHADNADELWEHFKKVIRWVESVFTNYYDEMKGINWGEYYSRFSGEIYDAAELAQKIKTLMMDYDIVNKKGIFLYVLTREKEEKHLNIRAFNEPMKRSAYERQDRKCARCGEPFDFDKTEADHIKPWSEGGKTVAENCQILCQECNRRKSNK